MPKKQTYYDPVNDSNGAGDTLHLPADNEGLHDPDSDSDGAQYNDADFAGDPMPPVGGRSAQTRITLPTLGEIDAALQALEHERMAERRRYVKAKRHLTDTRKFVIKQGATD